VLSRDEVTFQFFMFSNSKIYNGNINVIDEIIFINFIKTDSRVAPTYGMLYTFE